MTANARAEAFDHLRIAVREKPLDETERTRVQVMLRSDADKLVAFYPESKEGLVYNYDYFFPEETTQVDVFQTVGAEMVDLALGGYSTTCIGTGPSAAGKTHTLFGSSQEPGLIQLATKELFHRMAATSDRRYAVRFAYWEMSTDAMVDALVEDEEPGPLALRRAKEYGAAVVGGLKEVPVTTWEELDALLMQGNIRRIQLAEQRNARWHGFVRLFIDSTPAADPETRTSCMMTFVHLKGSDRVGQKGIRGEAARQGSRINQSLSLLGSAVLHCVDFRRKAFRQAGDDRAARRKAVESSQSFFMECKFTQVLGSAMAGNEGTFMVACVSTLDYHDTTDTLETLQNAQQLTAHLRRRTVRTDHGKVKQALLSAEAAAPKHGLAAGHPLSEIEERVEELRRRLGGEAVPAGGGPPPRQEVAPMYIPEQTHTWKQAILHAKMHGDRATVYMPTKGGKNNTYQGQWAYGQREGTGTQLTAKTKYEGGWAGGCRHGEGTLWVRPDEKSEWRRVYKGGWRDGKRDGKGVEWDENGDIYQGYFEAGKRSQLGQLFLKNGDRVEGQFAAGEVDGWASLHCANGDRFEGHWVGGQREGRGVWYYTKRQQLYRGEWHRGTPKCGVLEDMETKETNAATSFLPRLGLADPDLVLAEQRDRIDARRVEIYGADRAERFAGGAVFEEGAGADEQYDDYYPGQTADENVSWKQHSQQPHSNVLPPI